MSFDDQPTNDWRRIAVYSVSIAAIIVLGAWVYALPYLTVSQLREAAKAGDSETLSELVDFPSLRESLKETFKAMMLQQTTKLGETGLFAGFAVMIADVFVDKFVDAAVSPSGIAAMTQGKQPLKQAESKSEPPDSQEPIQTQNDKDPFSASMGYVSWSKFAVRFIDKDTGQEAIVLTLRRRGLTWQLTGLRLPLILNLKPEPPDNTKTTTMR
jgi:hypothetical protein